MLSRQEVNTMRHLANAQYWDRFSNCPLDRVLTYKNLIYLLNLQIYECQALKIS